MLSNLFINDPSLRNTWTDHVNAPLIRDGAGVKMAGPPQTYIEGKALAEQLLRSRKVIAGIEELSSPSGGLSAQMGLTVQQKEILSAAHVDPTLIGETEAIEVANALLTSTKYDPRKNLSASNSTTSSSITVPKGEDGKYLYWAPPMTQCDCGTPDEGRHIRYKWPCAYYRKEGDQSGRGQGAGGRGKGDGGGRGKGGKGKKGGKGHTANAAEEIAAAVAKALKDAPTQSATESTIGSEKAESVITSSTTAQVPANSP